MRSQWYTRHCKLRSDWSFTSKAASIASSRIRTKSSPSGHMHNVLQNNLSALWMRRRRLTTWGSSRPLDRTFKRWPDRTSSSNISTGTISLVSCRTTGIVYGRHSWCSAYATLSVRNTSDALQITCDLDLKESQREAELARQKDASESRILLESISHNVQTSASGIRELNEEIAIPSDQRARTVMLQELESIQKESTREDFESTVLRESIALTKLTLTPNYRWFRETFNAAHYTRSQIQEALIDTVHDIAGDLRDSGLLAHRTKAELASARTGLDQADIMFRVLDSRPKDVVLIRTFQRALFRAGGMQENDMVNPKLALAEGLVDAPM
ncbi:hypothetical protein C8F01DRAFT_1161050 [Mycena amicta]|nr:hypothetical protein C8F01DRAFT_1161050 [Mycena amicta]